MFVAPVDWNETIVWVYALVALENRIIVGAGSIQILHPVRSNKVVISSKHMIWFVSTVNKSWHQLWMDHVIFLTSHPPETNAARTTHYESELLSTVTTPLYVLLVANVLQSGALPQWCCCQSGELLLTTFDRDRREAVVAGGTIPLLSFRCLVEYPSLLLILLSYNSVHSIPP